jgi:hypothetical protein
MVALSIELWKKYRGVVLRSFNVRRSGWQTIVLFLPYAGGPWNSPFERLTRLFCEMLLLEMNGGEWRQRVLVRWCVVTSVSVITPQLCLYFAGPQDYIIQSLLYCAWNNVMQSCGLRDDGPCTRHNGVPPPQKHARLRLWGSSPPGSVAPCGLRVCLLPSLLYFVAGRL